MRPARRTACCPPNARSLEELGHLPLDFRAMWAVSNLFRSSAAIRRHMEANVLAADRLSWTAFVGLWVLWVWGEMEAREFAAAVGISRPTATGVMTTLESAGLRHAGARMPSDGRMVLVSLTPAGRTHDRAAVPASSTPRKRRGGGPPVRRPAGQPGRDAPLRSCEPRRRRRTPVV